MARPKAFDETEVLAQAVSVFHEKGYHDASMQDLVTSMGINRASMYDTFGDKHALYLKALDFYKKETTKTQSDFFKTDGSVVDNIRRFLMMIVEEECNDPLQKGCFITNAALEMLPQDVDTKHFVCNSFGDMRKTLTSMITYGQEHGEIKNTQSASQLALTVQAAIAGLRVLGKTRPERSDMTQVVENILSVLK
jgi:TetR/AcrR family transcriptional regulator, transcriptional repressor for nem operon